MPTKSVWTSKTLWVNVIAAIAAGVQQFLTGWAIDPEWQGAILAIVNIVLRLVTVQPVALRVPQDQDIPAAPRRLRRKVARDLANSVTRGHNANLLVVGLLALLVTACAGVQQRCDDMTLVLRDADLPTQSRLVLECDGQELGQVDVNLTELLGTSGVPLCAEPALVFKGENAQGLTVVDVQCNGVVMTTFLLDLGRLLNPATGTQPASLQPAVVVPAAACASRAPDGEVAP